MWYNCVAGQFDFQQDLLRLSGHHLYRLVTRQSDWVLTAGCQKQTGIQPNVTAHLFFRKHERRFMPGGVPRHGFGKHLPGGIGNGNCFTSKTTLKNWIEKIPGSFPGIIIQVAWRCQLPPAGVFVGCVSFTNRPESTIEKRCINWNRRVLPKVSKSHGRCRRDHVKW